MTAGAPRIFRTRPWVRLLAGAACAASVFGTAAIHRAEGLSLTVAGFGLISMVFAAAFAESMLARVVLRPDEIEYRQNFRRHVVKRSELVRAVHEKGGPIVIERASGGWIRLPVGLSGLHVNTLRAWLKSPQSPGDAGGREDGAGRPE